jgi:hypothetical protein
MMNNVVEESPNAAAQPPVENGTGKPVKERKLTMWALVFMTYFAVCGGPYGLEDAVGTGYPFFMILGMVLVR